MSGQGFLGLDPTLQYLELEIDSLDYTQGYEFGVSPLDWPEFQIGGKQPLVNIGAMKIIEAQIPFTWYTVTLANNTFTVWELGLGSGVDGGFVYYPTTLSIPPGNYDTTSFGTAMSLALTGSFFSTYVPGTSFTPPGGLAKTLPFKLISYTFVYNPSTGKYQINVVGGNASSRQGYFNFYFTFPASTIQTQSLAYIIGGPVDGTPTANSFLSPGASSVVVVPPYYTFGFMPNIANLTGPNYLYLNSRKLGAVCNIYLPKGQAFQHAGNAGPQLAKIPVNVNPGGVIYWSDPDISKYFDLSALNSLTQVDFYFTLGNDQSTPVLFNGQSFSLKLALLLNNTSKTDPSDPTSVGLFKRIRPS